MDRKRFLFIISIGTLFFLVFLFVFQQRERPKTELVSTSPNESQISLSPTILSTLTDEFTNARNQMVRNQIEDRGVSDQEVLSAMRNTPRHLFVSDNYIEQAYDDHPLPIGFGQTISQPYIVALMTEALELTPGDRVLEIGTGSGYQAAVLAEMEMEVFSIEIVPELAQRTRTQLDNAGYANITTINADGYYGWNEFAPYDAIIVTAAPDHLPQPLAQQLNEGGRMVVPIGPIGAVQTLWLFKKIDGELEAENLGPVRFVPFTRDQ